MNGFIAFMLIRCTQKTGTPTALPHIVSAPESALGSHPCVALSSAQVNSILHQVETLPKGRFLREATNPISGRFLLEATGAPDGTAGGGMAQDRARMVRMLKHVLLERQPFRVVGVHDLSC